MDAIACRNHLRIESEHELDDAFIEDTLGLVNDGDSITLVRRDSTKSVGFNNTSHGFHLQTEERISKVARNKKHQ